MKKKIINFVLISSIALIVFVLNVLILGPFASSLDIVFGSMFIDENQLNATRKEGEALALQIEQEGIVLLQNGEIEDEQGNIKKSLPLDNKITQLNVFGWATTEWIGGGSGSGRVVSSSSNMNVTTGLLEALEKNEIKYNTQLTDFYENYASGRVKFNNGTLNSYEYEFHRLIEPSLSLYDKSVLEAAKKFSSTALVVIGRMSGESSDAPKVQYKGTNISSTPTDSKRTYLDISTEEEELLTYVGQNYENVIVIINSTNTMNLSFLDNIAGLSSCLLVGATGINAAESILSILYGKASPSGRVVDTYTYDFSTAASYANSGLEGENFYTNGKNFSGKALYPADGTHYGNVGNGNARYPGVAYVDYSENIYVGYKWYETADKEGFWDSEYAKNRWKIDGYEEVVQFPFGYGLSYTDFSWEIIDINHQNNYLLNPEDDIKIKVRVTNIGDFSGKEVVQLYYSAPYYQNEIEKSAINLIAFNKTPTLNPGQYYDVELSFKVRDMASYDCYDKNNNNHTGYELDQGEYQIKLMKNAHEELELINTSVVNSTITYSISDNILFETDLYTNNEVDNKFTGENATDGVSLDGNNVQYMTRSNFIDTFPKLEAARSIDEKSAKYNLFNSAMAEEWKNDSDKNIVSGVNTDYKVFEDGLITELGLSLGKDYDNENWNQVLNQITESEMKNLVLHGYVMNDKVDSIGKPKFKDVDGPAQIGSFNQPNVGTGFPSATTIGQTFSTSLAYSFGLALGKETKKLGYDGWYGPGLNLHRSPFGGRNYEYYSEDSFLTGKMALNAVRGAKNTGVYSYLKHLAVYDQESYRDGLYTWLTEQALREIYIKPFQMAVQEGGATGIMTSYNRLGAVWAGASNALLNGVLREEWGFRGCVITDYADHHSYMSMDHAIRNGGDLYMDGWNYNGSFKFETSSASFKNALRKATKNILYMVLNAFYTNSIYNASDDVEPIILGSKTNGSWWKTIVYIADGIIFIGLLSWGIFICTKDKKEHSHD